jgi:hypothetical protein
MVLVTVAGMLALGLANAAPAFADGVVHWTGKGADSVGPCEGGEDPIIHWVFTTGGNDTVTAAVLTVNGTDYPMTQSGQGSWSADAVGTDPATTTAFVTYTGNLGSGQANLVMSHGCFGGPTYPPTTQPANVQPGVITQGGDGGAVQGAGGAVQGAGVAAGTEGAAGALAFTGAELTLLVAAFGILLAGGAVALIAARRRGRTQTG